MRTPRIQSTGFEAAVGRLNYELAAALNRIRAINCKALSVAFRQGTKSLRSSPLRGGKSREAGSQLRGQQ